MEIQLMDTLNYGREEKNNKADVMLKRMNGGNISASELCSGQTVKAGQRHVRRHSIELHMLHHDIIRCSNQVGYYMQRRMGKHGIRGLARYLLERT